MNSSHLSEITDCSQTAMTLKSSGSTLFKNTESTETRKYFKELLCLVKSGIKNLSMLGILQDQTTKEMLFLVTVKDCQLIRDNLNKLAKKNWKHLDLVKLS